MKKEAPVQPNIFLPFLPQCTNFDWSTTELLLGENLEKLDVIKTTQEPYKKPVNYLIDTNGYG